MKWLLLSLLITVVHSAPCANTDGTADNGVDCTCGTSQCTSETGHYCTSSVSVCSGAASDIVKYFFQSTGTMCPSGNRITSSSDCYQAHVANGGSNNVLAGYYGTDTGYDCTVYSQYYYQYNYNPGSGSSCSSEKPCVCKVSNPVTCSNSDGTVDNGQTCLCGDSLCTSSTGFSCYQPTSTCIKYDPCQNTDGTVDNGQNCQCGSTPCEGPKHYCSLINSYCGGEQSSPKNEFFLVTGTSGTTTVNGYRRCTSDTMPSSDDCREALPVYGKTTLSYYSYPQFPYGCWLSDDHRIMYNSYHSVTTHCSSTYPCVCRRDRFIETCYNGDGTTTTSIECECGDEDCSPGEYCNVAMPTNQKCSSTKSCRNTDGTQVLTENCRCNTEDCNSGEYCYFDDSSTKCRTIGICENGQNSVDCICGNALCDANQYCTLSTSICAPTDEVYAKAFLVKTSGNCIDSNLQEIDTLEECVEAASAVGWGSSVDSGYWNNYGGCYSKGSDGGVAFNDAFTTNCQSSYPCVCKSIQFPCQITDGLTENTDDCACGTTLCTSANGRYCTLSEKKCALAPPCTNFDGTVQNTMDCICRENPLVICTSDSGFYCYADKKQCAKSSGIVWWPNPRYQKLSGHCNEYILDANECLARATIVAQEMGFANPLSSTINNCHHKTPWGCSLEGFIHQTPRANLCMGSSASLNGVTETSACNQYVTNSYRFPCLCESDSFSPLCSNTDGSVPLTSTADCYCITDPNDIDGQHKCTRQSAPYCKVDRATRCLPYTDCANTLGQTSNAGACYCGSVTCSGSSLYCVSELNKCYQAKVCLNRDGTNQNDGPCLCGSTTCSESSGFYCYADNNLCGKAAGLTIGTAEGVTDFECLNQDGTSENTDQCVCGDEYCDAGKFCEPNDGPPDLKLITSGRCNDDPNYVGIYDDQACKDAMPTFGIIVHEHNFASHTNYWYARGCYIRFENGIQWPGNNHATSSNADYATNTHKLLCRLASRAIGDRGCFGCLYTDGLTANPDSCWCGDVSCSSSRRYCSTTLRQCVAGEPSYGGIFTKYMYLVSGTSSSCSDYPGWSSITTVQDCDKVLKYMSIDSVVNQISLDTYPSGCFVYQGTTAYLNSQGSDVECSPDNQCFCKAQGQQCQHQDGITVNPGDNCWCGDEFCTSGLTGLICSNGQCSRPNPCAGSDGYSLTTEICSCGNVDCPVGKYCYSGGSVCLDTKRCESIDGSQRNSDTCSCGNTLCTEYPGLGLRCNEAMNLCFLKICDPVFTGQETEPCLCGSAKTYCAPGSYCWSAKSQVSTSGIFSQYDMITSGSCTDDPDGSFIRSGSECNGKISQRTYSGVLPEYMWLTAPPACSLVHTWSAAYYFNPYDPLYRECEDCMCRYTQYPPCNSNIEVPNNAPCECGTDFCHEGTVFCDLQNNKCLPQKPCANKDHTVMNTDTCFCKHNPVEKNHWRDGAYTFLEPEICSASRYCDAQVYGCQQYAKCTHTEGLIPSTDICACGSSQCSPGQYCSLSQSKCFDYLPCQYNTPDNVNSQACACGSSQCTMYDNGVGTGLVCDQNTCYRPPTCQNNDAQAKNEEVCACGSVDCGPGLFCYESTSECKPYGYCDNTDGTVQNSDCTCGSVDCDGQTPYCHSDRDTCLSYPKCSERDGTSQNSGMCACGTTDCTNEIGLFCEFDNNKCRPGPPCENTNGLLSNLGTCACGTKDCVASSTNDYEYKIRTSGDTCVEIENGWGYIETAAHCTDAGQALGISASIEIRESDSAFHIGCIHYHSDNYPYNTNRLLFIEESVGNYYCGWGSAKCICKRAIGNYCEIDNNRCRPGPPCTNTEGLIPNTDVCACGGSDCPSNKLYCILDNQDCRPGPPCAVKDGTAATNEVCACGPTSDCSVGEFCYESQDRCKTYTHCEQTDGFTQNQVAECTCGADDCSTDKGLFCNLDIEVCGNIVRCQNNKGLLPNPDVCQCGYVQCDSQYGFYCYEDRSLCSHSTDFVLPHIRDHWSGCTGELRRITTDAECAQVVPGLWLRYDTEHKRNWYKDVVYNYVGTQTVRPQFEPFGCGLQSYDSSNPRSVVMWEGSSGAPCHSYERPCICALDTRACQDRSGTVVETQPCMCGNTFCTEPGRLCHAASDTCDYAPCSDQNGLLAHVSEYDGCTCNGESCNSETGLFCNADYDTNKCRKYPKCSNTAGTSKNSAECSCGAVDCTTDTGLYCNIDIQGGLCFKQPLCQNRDGLNVNNIACQCGLNQCAPKQTCLESSSECLFPECSEIDGFVPNQDTCDCGGEICSEENTYQYIGGGKCESLISIGGEYFSELSNNDDDKLLECMNHCIQHSNGLLARPIAFVIDSSNKCACTLSICASLSGSSTEYTSYHIIYVQDGGLHCSKTRKQCSSSNIFTAYKTRGNGCPLNINSNGANCPDYCSPGGSCSDSEGFSPLSNAECQVASAQWVVSNLFGLNAMKYIGNYISADSSGSTASWRPRGCTKTVYASSVYYRDLDADCKSNNLCTCKDESLCIYSREMPICTQRNGIVINDSPCICGKASCTSVSGLYCSIDTESCSQFPKCQNVQGLVQNDSPCVCGINDCPSSKLFCDISKSECRAYAKCQHPNGDITHSERCACGTVDCLEDQLCTEEQSLCQYPICSHTDGLSTNPPCICGSINCVSDPYCLIDRGICSNIPACASNDGSHKTDIACVCASNTRHENCLQTQYCDKNAQKQCFYEDCPETSGNVANTFDCACGNIDCFEGNPFCNIVQGRCQTKLTCPLVDGQIPNSVECDCGGDICDSSKPFCKLDVGECRAQRRCLEVDGTQPNTLICQCGEDGEECSGSNPYCNAQYKKCAPVANVIYELFYTAFWLQANYNQADTPMSKTTKTTAASVAIPYHTSCAAAGLEQITMVSECQAGSQLLWDYDGFYHKNDRILIIQGLFI